MVSFVWLSVVLFVLVDERSIDRGSEGSMRIAVGCGGACFMGQLCVCVCMCLSAFRVRVCLVVVCGACVCDVCDVCVVVVCVCVVVCL